MKYRKSAGFYKLPKLVEYCYFDVDSKTFGVYLFILISSLALI
jgi:hypothetical protein